MLAFSIRRILLAVPVLLAVVTLIFFLVRAMPGGPAVAMLGDYATPEAIEALEEEMGLNDPLPVQYFRFLGSLARGELGRSQITGTPVAAEVARVLPYTLELAVSAIMIGILLGIPLGVATSLRRNSALDYLGRTFSLSGVSLPSFFLGILLMFVFSIKLDLFPVMGGGDLLDLRDNLRHLFLPSLTLGLMMAAYITRTTRSSMLNVLGEDYIRTARAKGLPERKVIFGHALRTALIPVASFTGVYAIILIGNSVLVEVVFSRPGLGKMMVGAINQRDYLTLQSVMAVYATLVVLINLLTDLSYGLIDPRIRYD
ncbi:MAG: ABC transporter permease [Candidatus Glassbacteria bacterium]|nr:ABC transporter permease [Candidatus Glassbacteria bacterium]